MSRAARMLCRSCGQLSREYLRTRDYNRAISAQRFRYYCCSACGFVFLTPIPDDLSSYYPADYYGATPDLEELVAAAQIVEGYKLDLVRQFTTAGRLLEIGPAMGGFALLAKRGGFSVEAVELDPACCRFLNEVAAIPTVRAVDELSALAKVGRCDVVTLWQVIEHLRDPWALLQAVRDKLATPGFIVIAAPNPESLQLRLLRGRWVHVDAPRHLCLIPINLLRKQLEQLGLQIVHETFTDPGSLYWNEFGWRYSFANLAGAKPGGLAGRLGSHLSRLLRPLEQSGRRGSAYVVVAKKSA